jgi:hypothetical protein
MRVNTLPVTGQGTTFQVVPLGLPLNPTKPANVALAYTQPLLQGAGFRVNTAPIVIARLNTAQSFFLYKDSVQEMVRGGISDVAIDVTVYYEGEPLDSGFVASLPFRVRTLAPGSRFEDAVRNGDFDYVMLFESSGMYRGEDLAALASHLVVRRLDAVWGSRRLSVRDIAESLRFRYQKTPFFGALSAVGSHVLSLACLTLYGRYISDTLSGVRAIRTEDALSINVPLTHKRANQHLLARLLRRKAEILEIPVQFFPISPERVKRTSITDGLGSLAALFAGRLTAAGGSASIAEADRAAAQSAEPSDKRRTTPATTR